LKNDILQHASFKLYKINIAAGKRAGMKLRSAPGAIDKYTVFKNTVGKSTPYT
jgi:hypothetical protein